jgi:hypothetical protein
MFYTDPENGPIGLSNRLIRLGGRITSLDWLMYSKELGAYPLLGVRPTWGIHTA